MIYIFVSSEIISCMNQRTFFWGMLVICLSLLACQPSGTPNLLSELNSCDSAVVMYYKSPGNPRFFQMVKVYDSNLLRTLADNANQFAQTGIKDCVSEGKIYYYGDKGEVYVLYFTSSCSRLSFINTGEKYSVRLHSRSKSILDSLQAYAYEPLRSN